MRENMFRGIDLAKDWVYGSLVKRYNGYIGIDFFIDGYGYMLYEVNPDTVGEYTGTNDKNGAKIFEWDIVTIGNGAFVVVFENGCWILRNERTTKYLYNYTDVCEVIGNVFDDEELLGEELCNFLKGVYKWK